MFALFEDILYKYLRNNNPNIVVSFSQVHMSQTVHVVVFQARKLRNLELCYVLERRILDDIILNEIIHVV